jgi:signal transduction histidine kinase
MSDMANAPLPPTILIVDDDATQRFLSREALEARGYRVEEAERGDEGFETAKSLEPDLILIDVMMPGLNGYELCEAVRRTPGIDRTPMILVTALEDLDSIEHGFQAGANDFLVKPITWALLGYRVQFALRTADMEREMRVAKEDVELASRAKSILLSNMSHELRTPLNAIIGFSEYLRQQNKDTADENTREYLDYIYTSGRRLLATINDVLDMANLESGRLVLSEDRVDIPRMIAAVVKHFAPAAEEKSLTIDCSGCAGAPTVLGDPEMLKRVIGNLLSNAIKFSEQGNVWISASVENGDLVRISVRDAGRGMSEGEVASILEPFRQVDQRLSRDHQGTGLGVPIARAMMELHGGRLEYSSSAGEGTVASAVFPLRTPNSGRKKKDASKAAE